MTFGEGGVGECTVVILEISRNYSSDVVDGVFNGGGTGEYVGKERDQEARSLNLTVGV